MKTNNGFLKYVYKIILITTFLIIFMFILTFLLGIVEYLFDAKIPEKSFIVGWFSAIWYNETKKYFDNK